MEDVATALPSSVMNLRRLMSGMGLPSSSCATIPAGLATLGVLWPHERGISQACLKQFGLIPNSRHRSADILQPPLRALRGVGAVLLSGPRGAPFGGNFDHCSAALSRQFALES